MVGIKCYTFFESLKGVPKRKNAILADYFSVVAINRGDINIQNITVHYFQSFVKNLSK